MAGDASEMRVRRGKTKKDLDSVQAQREQFKIPCRPLPTWAKLTAIGRGGFEKEPTTILPAGTAGGAAGFHS